MATVAKEEHQTDEQPEEEGESSAEGRAVCVMHDGTQYVLRVRYTTARRRLNECKENGEATANLILSSGKRVSVNPALVAAIEEQ